MTQPDRNADSPPSATLKEHVGQLLVAGFDGLEPPPELLAQISAGRVSGVILFRRNIVNPGQLVRLVRAIQQANPSDRPLIIAIDQEGGRVVRFPPTWAPWPPAAELGRSGDPKLIERVGRTMGAQLAAFGINVDFAPVLDVASNPQNPIIGDRAFAADAQAVGPLALAFAAGLRKSGVTPCGKHFPGHGDTTEDSHKTLPRVERLRPALESTELVPFVYAAAELEMMMTAHVVYPAWDSENPATLSPFILNELLRKKCNFSGVVVSDDLEMQAVAQKAPIEDLALGCVQAGVDLLLICRSLDRTQRAFDSLCDAARKDPALAQKITAAASRIQKLRTTLSAAAPDLPLAQQKVQDPAERAKWHTLLQSLDETPNPQQ
jgi:beta-N-acetylhexosaminidase